MGISIPIHFHYWDFESTITSLGTFSYWHYRAYHLSIFTCLQNVTVTGHVLGGVQITYKVHLAFFHRLHFSRRQIHTLPTWHQWFEVLWLLRFPVVSYIFVLCDVFHLFPIIWSNFFWTLSGRHARNVKNMEERKMKITFQKWIPNIVKRGNNFQVKKKKMSLLLHGILKSLFASNLSGSGKS